MLTALSVIALATSPIAFIIWLIVLCVVIWAAKSIMGAFGLPQPIQTVIYVLLVLFVVLWIVGELGGGMPSLR